MARSAKARQKAAKRMAVLERWGPTCWLCRKPIDLDAPMDTPGAFSLDHVIPKAYGGRDDIRNLRPAHRLCNNKRGHRYSVRARLRVFA